MPNNPRGGGVSRRIEGEERNELRDVMDQIEVPKGMSIIARTAGIGRAAEELQWDLNYLTQLWTAIEEASHISIWRVFNLSRRQLGDSRDSRLFQRGHQRDFNRYRRDVYEQAVQFMNHVMPGNVGTRQALSRRSAVIFALPNRASNRICFLARSALPSGGAIVIDHTEALVSVDVNSGRAIKGADIEQTAFNTN